MATEEIVTPSTPAAETTSAPASVPADKTVWQRLKHFSSELWNDHDFWIRALAIKGGASAVIIAGVVGISYVVAMPFLLATTVVAACLGLVGLGIYGICLGTVTSWEKLKSIYSKTVSTKPPKPVDLVRKPFYQKLLESKFVKRLTEHPLAQKFLNSHTWKYTRTIAKKQQDFFLTGLAGGGSIFFGTLGVIALVTQVAVLPVVAVGSILTFGTVAAVGGVISGVYGLYLSIEKFAHSIGERRRVKKEKAAAEKKDQAEQEAPAPQSPEQAAAVSQSGADALLAVEFNKKANTPAPEEKPLPEAASEKKSATPPAPPAV